MRKKKHDQVLEHELRKGAIKHSAIAALVRSPLFKSRVEKAGKGKGSYSRKSKNNRKGVEPYLKTA